MKLSDYTSKTTNSILLFQEGSSLSSTNLAFICFQQHCLNMRLKWPGKPSDAAKYNTTSLNIKLSGTWGIDLCI